ncbi:MAG TPA: RsmE family RNA methyltransferase [Caldilineaceae bacterium]|nr:RsmE family RNA methyltransferase [Caldilineaceae bacterium]
MPALHRFFLPSQGWSVGSEVDLTPLHHQLARVLRAAPGDRIVLLDGRGSAYLTEIRAIDRRRAAGLVAEVQPAPPEPALRLTLYQCALKADKLEWVWQKGTELGVVRFVPVVSRRTLARPALFTAKARRWQTIVREAAEQCQRGAVPVVEPAVELAAALQAAQGIKLLPWEAGAGRPGLAAALRALPDGALAGEISLLIGPEGGLEEDEVTAAEAAGWQIVSLGSRILRAETAALAAATLVMAAAGELGAAATPPAPPQAAGEGRPAMPPNHEPQRPAHEMTPTDQPD